MQISDIIAAKDSGGIDMKRVGVIGLGNIGSKIAANLIEAGFDVVGFDLARNESFIEQGGQWAESVQALAQSVDVIVHSLPAVSVLVSTVDKLLEVVKEGQVVIELSSYPLQDKQAQAQRLAARGVIMLDCEISGLPVMVANRTAVIFQAGDKNVVDSVADVFSGLTETYFYLGKFGTATKMKLLANAMVCVHNMMSAEILNLASRAGMDTELVFNTLKNSAAGSATFTNKAPIMLSRDFDHGAGPFGHMFHYLARVGDLADECGATTPLISEATKYYQKAEAEQRHTQDIAALIEIMEETSEV
ncbi:MAG: 3-hydroxyisobutyrate dehydrogenase-like beta-hydroxyacid dehydrogenase [Alcanivorax sp.]|jgi:3-hydroxyisobutyrate dehydrogenase-like beta-hydroxyacid dehydrogenase